MSFKERVRQRLAMMWWSMNGDHSLTPFTIPTEGLRAKHLAVILPPDFADFDVARYAFDQLVYKLQPYKCTVLVRDNFRSWLTTDTGAHFFTYDPNRKNLLGFPENQSCQEARNLDADVVIDLTPQFSQYTAGLAAATHAPLRVSLDKEYANRFFNLIVQPARGRSLQEQYHVLLTHI
jgi:hypothetical protein